ncbi:MAG: cytochrome c [Paracoccaceae bacterium]
MKQLKWLAAAAVIAGAAAYFLTLPQRIDPSSLSGLKPDIAAGAQVFAAGGCASCHAAPDATRTTRLQLAGGQAFASPFGTFYAPNISPDPIHGIGTWQAIDLANAMKNGTSPDRQHYFPVFPYTSYSRASLQDIVSLHAYLQSLPAVSSANRPHDVGFPFNVRASLGGWKLLFMRSSWVLKTVDTPEIERGRYLVEALSHCSECHTPRNILGGLKTSKWLTGAPNPTGRGTVPNITPAKLTWSDADLLNYFKTGFTPDFDTAGGLMSEVIENLSQLPDSDLAAIIAYLRAVPAIK